VAEDAEKTKDAERFAEAPSKKKASKKKGGKALLSFGGMMATTTLAKLPYGPRRPSSILP